MLQTRASILARYWYCAEECRLLFNGFESKPTEAKSRGDKIHKWLAQRPKTPTEIRLISKLEELKPFYRDYKGVRIFGTPDDYKVKRKKVALEEYKSVSGWGSVDFWEKFEYPCAEFQINTYHFIMQPILERLGYELKDLGYIYLFDRTGRFMRKYSVRFIESMYLADLDTVLAVVTGEMQPIPPKSFKCKTCEFRGRGCRL
mgnify:CR=1 FL=1